MTMPLKAKEELPQRAASDRVLAVDLPLDDWQRIAAALRFHAEFIQGRITASTALAATRPRERKHYTAVAAEMTGKRHELLRLEDEIKRQMEA